MHMSKYSFDNFENWKNLYSLCTFPATPIPESCIIFLHKRSLLKLFHCGWVLPVLKFHIKRTVHDSFRLLSLSRMFLRFFHLYMSLLCSPLLLLSILLYEYTTFI